MNSLIKKKVFYSVLLLFIVLYTGDNCARPLYFCTASDARYFNPLINLIGSIHKHHFDQLGEIAVFDLGFTDDQRGKLNSIQKVAVYGIEKKHADILKPVHVGMCGKAVRDSGTGQMNIVRAKKMVPGWYAWKPVAIKQSLDMFPYVLWLDAGTTLLKPIGKLFDHILVNGYFFHNGSRWKMKKQTCLHQTQIFDLQSPGRQWVLESTGLESGVMGFTRATYKKFVLPIYELAADLRNFSDDGSSEGGWGSCRHDQTIFSVQALLLGLKIHDHFEKPKQNFYLKVGRDNIPFHITSERGNVDSNTCIYCSRSDVRNYHHYRSFIRYE